MPLAMSLRRARPVGALAVFLALVGGALALGVMALAYCMAYPARWDGPGRFGALALFFPLHLLIFTLVAAALARFARRQRARLGAWLFGLAAVLSALMGLTPAVAAWQRARELGVPVSLIDYVVNAGRMNHGQPQPERSVVYGTAQDGTKLELDVWTTSAQSSGPLHAAVVLVHGGAWTHGNRSMLPDWNRWLNQLGYQVFDVEYRLPPPARWLDEVGDVKSALGWVAEHAAEYQVDPSRIIVMGGSAGANLAMLAAYSAGDPALPSSTPVPAVRPRAVVNFYGPTDLALLYRDCKSPSYARSHLEQYIGGTPEAVPDRYRALSPLTHVDSNAPPTLTLIGSSDRLVALEHATLLDEALAKAGVAHATYVLPASDHGFDSNWGGFGTQIARAELLAFLEQHGGGRRAQ